MQIEIPKDVESLFAENANRAGFDSISEYVVNLVLGDDDGQHADDGTNENAKTSPNGGAAWNDKLNARRCELIDKEIQTSLNEDERRELESLTNQFREYRRKVAPLPIDGARRIHAELLKKKQAHERPGDG
jgi:hypothetical protein